MKFIRRTADGQILSAQGKRAIYLLSSIPFFSVCRSRVNWRRTRCGQVACRREREKERVSKRVRERDREFETEVAACVSDRLKTKMRLQQPTT